MKPPPPAAAWPTRRLPRCSWPGSPPEKCVGSVVPCCGPAPGETFTRQASLKRGSPPAISSTPMRATMRRCSPSSKTQSATGRRLPSSARSVACRWSRPDDCNWPRPMPTCPCCCFVVGVGAGTIHLPNRPRRGPAGGLRVRRPNASSLPAWGGRAGSSNSSGSVAAPAFL